MLRKTPTIAIMGVLLLSACATPNPRQDTPTDVFIDNTLRQYGVGPGGRVATPDAVLVDPNPETPEAEEDALIS